MADAGIGTEAESTLQGYDRIALRSRRGIDRWKTFHPKCFQDFNERRGFPLSGAHPAQIAKDRPCLDARKLIRIADQDQARIGVQRLQQRREQVVVDHRCLVNDHDIGGELALLAKPKAPARRLVAEQAMKRGCRRGNARLQILVVEPECLKLLCDALAHPVRCLARRRRQCDVEVRVVRKKEHHQPDHRRRLSGAGATCDTQEPALQCGRRSNGLPVHVPVHIRFEEAPERRLQSFDFLRLQFSLIQASLDARADAPLAFMEPAEEEQLALQNQRRGITG